VYVRKPQEMFSPIGLDGKWRIVLNKMADLETVAVYRKRRQQANRNAREMASAYAGKRDWRPECQRSRRGRTNRIVLGVTTPGWRKAEDLLFRIEPFENCDCNHRLLQRRSFYLNQQVIPSHCATSDSSVLSIALGVCAAH